MDKTFAHFIVYAHLSSRADVPVRLTALTPDFPHTYLSKLDCPAMVLKTNVATQRLCRSASTVA